LKEADALIIDLRYGLGGAAPSYLNIFNTNIPILKMHHRDGTVTVFDSQWRKQAVYLVNGYSRSGKELLAYGATYIPHPCRLIFDNFLSNDIKGIICITY
jgi:carboxyl-terminal processing protease